MSGWRVTFRCDDNQHAVLRYLRPVAYYSKSKFSLPLSLGGAL